MWNRRDATLRAVGHVEHAGIGRNGRRHNCAMGQRNAQPPFIPPPRAAEGERGSGGIFYPRLTPWAKVFRPSGPGVLASINHVLGSRVAHTSRYLRCMRHQRANIPNCDCERMRDPRLLPSAYCLLPTASQLGNDQI